MLGPDPSAEDSPLRWHLKARTHRLAAPGGFFLRAEGSQVIMATHSPLLAALPGATTLELGDWGIRPVPWEELELIHTWRDFLAAPQRYLRHLLDPD